MAYGIRIGRLPFRLEVFLEVVLFSLLIFMNVATSNAQPGFLSIDCGSTQAPHKDELGLSWVNDSTYTRTGSNSYLQGDVSASTDNHQALRDFHYFPERRNKHCYELPTTANTSYLIRAMFYYFESQAIPLPIQFTVSVNATNWFSVTYSKDTAASAPLIIQEGIFYSVGNIIYFCLVPIVGIPFISSLELRPLDPDGIMYSYTGSKGQYLSNVVRINYGAASGAPTVRFPDDAFDRLWYNKGYGGRIGGNRSIQVAKPPDTKTRAAVNNVPPKVMRDASVSEYLGYGIGIEYNLSSPVDGLYAAFYFEELDSTKTGGRSMTFTFNVDNGGQDPGSTPFSVTDHASMQVFPYLILASAYDIEYTLWPADSTSDAIVNAVEIYGQNYFNFSTTFPPDGFAIRALQTSVNLTDWQGDPCTPVPHDWLTCTSVTTVGAMQCPWTDQTKCMQQGYFPRSTSRVITLELSNLTGFSNSHFSDSLEDLSGSIGLLSELSLVHCEIDTPTLQFLLMTFLDGARELIKLDLSNNFVDAIPWSGYNVTNYYHDDSTLAYLNLSNNRFFGEVPSFVDMPYVNSLLELNLSYNAMTFLPSTWGDITGLAVLDLSHNSLTGEISSLDELVSKNVGSLKELYISNNKLTGKFTDRLYFSGFTNLTTANFDGNHIEGTLNLTTWHESLKEAVLNSNAVVIGQLFSFVNNDILDITPKAEDIHTTINNLLKTNPAFKDKGVLLGGNPYCKGAKSQAQWYLCRSTIHDVIPGGKSQNTLIIALAFGITGGILLYLCFGVLIGYIWKLRKQLYILRKIQQEIQQALVDRKVQPPFFLYNDLKLATGDFHMDNKLGQGAFGVVYKGRLPDGTMLGVKKLFTSAQEAKVLNEFLNEVVLITGIKHRNLVQLKGCCIQDNQRILVYEFVQNGNLAEALWGSKPHGTMGWEQCRNICVGLARGLSYLHEELQPCIIHRDIKPANILLDKYFRPKIADFGLAKPFSDERSRTLYTRVAGTYGYFAPEYATKGRLTEKADVYSYGTVVLEIVSGRKCIDHSLPDERMYLHDWAQEMHEKGTLLNIVQPHLREKSLEIEVIQAINIGLSCVQADPRRRPTMSQVVTMFSGTMDVMTFLDESNHNYHDLERPLLSNDHDMQFPNESLQRVRVIQESQDFPSTFNADNQDSSITNGGGSMELSNMVGR